MSSLHLQRFTGNQIAKVHQRQPEKFQNTEVSTHDLCLTYYPRKSSSDYSFVCCVCVCGFRESRWSAVLLPHCSLVIMQPLTTVMVNVICSFTHQITQYSIHLFNCSLSDSCCFRVGDESAGYQDQVLVSDLSGLHCTRLGAVAWCATALHLCAGEYKHRAHGWPLAPDIIFVFLPTGSNLFLLCASLWFFWKLQCSDLHWRQPRCEV